MGNLHLLYSCDEWGSLSSASLRLVTSDDETLYAAIGGGILTGGMEYDGKTGGAGFAEYKKNYLDGNAVPGCLKYGFIKELDEALLSEPDTIPEYCAAAYEFPDAAFRFDPAEFDRAYGSDDTEWNSGETEDENDMEI
jgi:hypothetical protein